jgi:multisubunit Na+/H+ antiporter MnhF subunit
MSAWFVAAIGLTLGYVLCGIVILRGKIMERIVAGQMFGIVSVLELELLAQAVRESFFIDLSLTLALLLFPAGMAFVYFYARWI